MEEGESSAALFANVSSENTSFIVSKEAQPHGGVKIESPPLSETTITQPRQIQQPTPHVDSLSATDKTSLNLLQPEQVVAVTTPVNTVITKQIKKPILKRTFALKKVGYKVIPYEDEYDSRYSFKNENVVFVNKANSTYKAESTRGEEFLLRHIISIVAEALAETKHPEGKDALELQNRLVAEAIRIHDRALTRK
jgi:hypothetical protein